jgi:hypothetical protein
MFVNGQRDIENGVSDDWLSEKWKELIGLTESGAQGAEEFSWTAWPLTMETLGHPETSGSINLRYVRSQMVENMK